MTTNYQGNSASYPANIRLPSDGDKRNATILAMASSDLADRTAFLSKTLSDKTALLAGSGGQVIPMFGQEISPASSFVYIQDSQRGYWSQAYGRLNPQVRCEVSQYLHAGEKIVSFAAAIKGGTGHTSLPATMPKLRLKSVDWGDDISTSYTDHIVSTDTAPSVTYYQSMHAFWCRFSTPLTVDGGRLYQIVLEGEDGDGAQGGLVLSNLFLKKTL